VVPRVAERAMGLMGRYAPRTVALPIMQRVTQRGLKSRGK
jgi:hypothetical protein